MSRRNPLLSFIREARARFSIMGPGNEWSAPYWDIGQGLRSRSSVARRRQHLLWFTREVPKGVRTLVRTRAATGQTLSRASADFAKAVIVSYFADRPRIGYVTIYTLVRSLVSVLVRLPENASPTALNLEIFLQAEAEIIERMELKDGPLKLSWATARSAGERLQTLSTLLDGWEILPARILFKTKIPLQRREEVDRHSKPFENRKKRLFPEPDVFYFLAELANRDDIPEVYRLPLRAVELQIALGRRVSEVLLLPNDTLVDGDRGSLGVRYFAEKNADPFVAWVPRDQHFESACEIVRRAVADIKEMTADARRVAARWESCRNWRDVPLPNYSQCEWKAVYPFKKVGGGKPTDWLLASEFQEAFGLSDIGNFMRQLGMPIQMLPPIARFGELEREVAARLARNGIRVATAPFKAVRVQDLKRALLARAKDLASVDAPGERRLRLSEMLFVVPEYWGGTKAKGSSGLVQAFATHYINRFLTGTLVRGERGGSIFQAYGRPELSAKSHGFRRWVTTEGRRAGVNNLVLARWMGRTAVQNDVYDYNEPVEFSDQKLGISTDLSNVLGTVRDVAEDMATREIPIAERQEFLTAELKGLIITEKGGCSHEWAVTPCTRSRACFNGCPDFYVIKGRKDHYERAISERAKLSRALELSKMQIGTAYYANGYVQMNERQLKHVNEAIRVYEDDSIPNGTLVQLTARVERGTTRE